MAMLLKPVAGSSFPSCPRYAKHLSTAGQRFGPRLKKAHSKIFFIGNVGPVRRFARERSPMENEKALCFPPKRGIRLWSRVALPMGLWFSPRRRRSAISAISFTVPRMKVALYGMILTSVSNGHMIGKLFYPRRINSINLLKRARWSSNLLYRYNNRDVRAPMTGALFCNWQSRIPHHLRRR